ncbi:hypothetical protein [Dyella amyloliquefaciens]|uniref:hypothetical protein n=1 Tax=Dyella amyloliquefaciens TaxID=1770545 RepID=UPI001E2D0209|nr:hypothetical protein [Dyella amyloliquefaciens]
MLKGSHRGTLRHHELRLMTDLGQKQDDFRDGNQRHARGDMASRKPADDAAHKPSGDHCGRQLP